MKTRFTIYRNLVTFNSQALLQILWWRTVRQPQLHQRYSYEMVFFLTCRFILTKESTFIYPWPNYISLCQFSFTFSKRSIIFKRFAESHGAGNLRCRIFKPYWGLWTTVRSRYNEVLDSTIFPSVTTQGFITKI